jgi:hypothetical protein
MAIEHQLSLIAFLMEKVISDAIREAMRKAITVRMEKVISDAIREAIRKAITVRMVKVDGGIARPDPTPTCLAHLIIDDHAYVAYPWTAVGCWARAHAVRSVRLPQSEVIRGHQRSSEVITGHQRSSEAIRGHQRPSEVIRGH